MTDGRVIREVEPRPRLFGALGEGDGLAPFVLPDVDDFAIAQELVTHPPAPTVIGHAARRVLNLPPPRPGVGADGREYPLTDGLVVKLG
jgi:hypothetical protein